MLSLKYAGLLPICFDFSLYPEVLHNLVSGERKPYKIIVILQIAGGLICAAPWTRQKRLEAPLQKKTIL